jgi:ribose transport system ATP-binding protein
MQPATAPILELRQICKAFFGVPVLRDVGCSVARGSILGLVGENGAGKSTLMNILGGIVQPDAGHMLFDEQPYAPGDARQSAEQGIALIHQELNLFENLTVAENLHLPAFPWRRLGRVGLPLIDHRAMRRRATEMLEATGVSVPVGKRVADLSPGERQLVEIARALGAAPRLIIFDEPTTSLSTRETERLFQLIGRLRDRGTSMIYISHNLGDVLKLCNDIVILRDGQVVGSGPATSFTTDQLITLMVGRQIEQLYPSRAPFPSGAGEPLLEAKSLSRGDDVQQINLSVRRGEVVGIFGLMGAGRTELARLIFGLDRADAGDVAMSGNRLRPSPRRSIRGGMAFVTKDRRAEGLMTDATVTENASLVSLPRFTRTPFKLVDRSRMTRRVNDSIAAVHLTGVSRTTQPVRTLSGGNQQKVVFAKWLANQPDLLILDEPTRGVDVGAKFEIYKLINQLVAGGAGVLFISSEIEELIGMCDRILVMSGGRITGELPYGSFDRDRLLSAAFGEGAPA